MTKLLLCCDEYIYENNHHYYFKNKEWHDFFYRYLRVFDKIRLITRCKIAPYNSNWVELDLNDIEYRPLPFFQGPVEYARNYFKVGKHLKEAMQGCDCAILRLPFTVSERLGKKLIKKRMPYAVEVVFDAEDGWRNSTSYIEKMLWLKIDKNMRFLSNNADGVSCVTEFYLQKHYFSKKPNSFTSHYSSLSLDKSFYSSPRQYPSKEVLTIAHVANQVEYNGRKGHIEIIKALAELKKQGIIVNVRFAGEDYFGGCDRLNDLASSLGVKEQVCFLGYLQRSQLSSFLDEADLYVMPTKAEGLPRVIIEAMAKGLPCVTTNVSGNSELVESRFLYDDYHDYIKLAELIKEIVSNKDIYEATSTHNFETSLGYEASVLQERRDEFYKKLRLISEK